MVPGSIICKRRHVNIQELRKFKNQLETIASKYAIKEIYIFGSVARGDSGIRSDIDFLIEMKDDASALGVGVSV